jgi:hypothetical protein
MDANARQFEVEKIESLSRIELPAEQFSVAPTNYALLSRDTTNTIAAPKEEPESRQSQPSQGKSPARCVAGLTRNSEKEVTVAVVSEPEAA